jgi:formyl-CoA transferase
MHLVGRPELVDEPWFASGAERAQHADELDEAVGSWIAARDRDEVVRAFEEAQAAVAPIYDVRDVMADPQFAALGSLVRVPDPELGSVLMQNVLFRLSDTPGKIETAGPSIGQHTEEVLGELGLDADAIAELRRQGAV